MSPLRKIREARGLSQPALAKLVRTSQQQIDRLEKGQRALTLKWARRLAPALGVQAHELGPDQEYEIAPVKGYVGAGEEVRYFEDQGDRVAEEVEAPPGEHDSVALRVRGDSMNPRYFEGELIFYSRLRGTDPANCLYEDCVVRLADGRTLLKLIEPGSEAGTYTLRSYNPNTPIMTNRKLDWMAPVVWRGPRRRDPLTRKR
ncbi:MAG TPA: helix-turn-helix domain-containing protein [Alphaproteobacteria bacterium]|nr:helix-turn-helix domain-containing protein [Alphaproteobacteria bacterium]